MAEGAAAGADAIRLDRVGAIGRVTLGPGLASAADWRAWTAALDQWIADPNVYGALVLYAGTPLRDVARQPALDDLVDLYRLIWTIDRFSKPTVVLLDGPMSWADFCLVRHGTHKVAGDGFRLDLTVPANALMDAGATWWLARMPAAAAEPGALLGTTIDAAQSLAFGLLTHHVASSSFAAVEKAYADADPIDQVLDGLPQLSSGAHAPVGAVRQGTSLDDSLIREARTLSLKQTLERDYAIAMTRAEGGAPGAWPGHLAAATAALALEPPAGVPQALG